MNGIKGYISIREAAYRWGVSKRRVNQYCAEGRIPGTSRFGRSWAIPEDAEKPADPRKKRKAKRSGGTRHAKTKMESEYRLHIRTSSGESATNLPLRNDHGGGTYGLWQNNGSELVSG